MLPPSLIEQVLSALSEMDSSRFEKFVPRLYPHCTRLICSDQVHQDDGMFGADFFSQ